MRVEVGLRARTSQQGKTVDGPLRVVRILTRFNVGGPARQALALQEEMGALDVSTLLVGGTVQDGEADLADLLGVTDVLRIPALGRRVSPFDDARAAGALYRLLRRVRPHVVHTHMAKAGTVGRLAAAAARVPVRVHTFHGHTLNGYFGRLGTTATVAAERFLARGSSGLVAVSPQVRDDLLARKVGRLRRFHVVEAALDLDPYLDDRTDGAALRPRLGIPIRAPVIGMAGRLVPVKGIPVFLDAVMPILAERSDVHVVIGGDGPEAELVRSAAATSPDRDRIHLLGWVVDMASFYRAVDVVALSSFNEGTPLSLIEAAAAGLPVAATRVGGVPEVVVDGETGYLVPAGSAEELGRALRALIADPARARRMGMAGREHVRRFSARRTARELASLYRSLLAERGIVWL